MILKRNNISKSFIIGVIALVLFAIAVVIIISVKQGHSTLLAIIIDIIMFSSGILAVIGIIYFFKGFREPKRYKYFISFIIHVSILVFMLIAIVSLIVDIYKLYSG